MGAPLQSYTNARHNQFIANAKRLGYRPWHYNGRFWYSGPAARIGANDLHEFLSEIGVPCVWDNLGHDYVVYPKG